MTKIVLQGKYIPNWKFWNWQSHHKFCPKALYILIEKGKRYV